MSMHKNQLVQNIYNFAIIDEVDSILIDDSRTPLIISGPSTIKNEYKYYSLNSMVYEIYNLQKKIIIEFLQDIKKKKNSLSIFRAYRGLPKYRPLIKYLSIKGIKKKLQQVENYYIQDGSKMMFMVDLPLLFVIDEKNNNIELTDKGINYIMKLSKDAN